MDDWPTLEQAIHTSEKKKSGVITNGETKQNGNCKEKSGNHDDSDESQSSQINSSHKDSAQSKKGNY